MALLLQGLLFGRLSRFTFFDKKVSFFQKCLLTDRLSMAGLRPVRDQNSYLENVCSSPENRCPRAIDFRMT